MSLLWLLRALLAFPHTTVALRACLRLFANQLELNHRTLIDKQVHANAWLLSHGPKALHHITESRFC